MASPRPSPKETLARMTRKEKEEMRRLLDKLLSGEIDEAEAKDGLLALQMRAQARREWQS